MKAWNWYLTDQMDQQNPIAIPLLIEYFKNTPPTLILLTEHDRLRDEGKQLAENMKTSEIPVKITHYKEIANGFLHMGAVLRETREAFRDIAAFTKENLK
ncbi:MULTISPECIES: alpha/beta hydrolase [Sphingobacterium]|uniref:alpha/beta hydrolase n=1 Tax=Sphingobacterium TaxID=28453 RepID=UPI001EF4DE10|nr:MULTISPECIES: alpha/beta hydrolase [Sphingobacterium]